MTLLSQSLAAFGQGVFVLCARSDGQVRIECMLIGCSCCRERHERVEEQRPECSCHHDDESAQEELLDAIQQRCCTDYPLLNELVVSGKVRQDPTDTSHTKLFAQLPGLSSSGRHLCPTWGDEYLWLCGHPCDDPPTFLARVILRC